MNKRQHGWWYTHRFTSVYHEKAARYLGFSSMDECSEFFGLTGSSVLAVWKPK